jgi:hypothetical protein
MIKKIAIQKKGNTKNIRKSKNIFLHLINITTFDSYLIEPSNVDIHRDTGSQYLAIVDQKSIDEYFKVDIMFYTNNVIQMSHTIPSNKVFMPFGFPFEVALPNLGIKKTLFHE